MGASSNGRSFYLWEAVCRSNGCMKTWQEPKGAGMKAAEEFGGKYAENPYVQKLAAIYADASAKDNGRTYEMDVSPWEKGDNSRLYLSMSESRTNGKLVSKVDYGYVDLKTGQYHKGSGPKTLEDGRTFYGFSGADINPNVVGAAWLKKLQSR